MTIEIKAPTLPESVPDGTIATWYKKPGESVSRDELIVDIETDKVVLEVVAPADGVLKDIKKAEGDTIVSNEVLAIFEEGAVAAAPAAVPAAEEVPEKATPAPAESDEDQSNLAVLLSPAARKLVEENNLDANLIQSTGKDGRITKEDVVNYMKAPAEAPTPAPPVEAPVTQTKAVSPPQQPIAGVDGARAEKRVPISRLRAKVAERLLQALR